MIEKIVALPVMVFLVSWVTGELPWGNACSSWATLCAAAVLIGMATWLVSHWVVWERDQDKKGRSPLRQALVIHLGVLAGLIVLRRYDANAHTLLILAVSVVLLSTASLLGIALARGVKQPSELIPVCVVAAWADLCSVVAGPTHAMVRPISDYYAGGQQGAPPLADELLIKTLVPGQALPQPLFGVTDWIVVAFLCAALARLELSSGPRVPYFIRCSALSAKHVPVAPLGLYLALFCAHFSGGFLPALVFIGGAVLAWVLSQYPQARRISRRELLLTVLFPLLMTLGIVFF